MTKEMEQKVLEALYDRLFQAVTYVPDGKTGVGVSKDSTFIQFSSFEALNADDFKNASSPQNPKGDLRTAENFSKMVDILPTPGPRRGDTNDKLSAYYQEILNANVDAKPDPEQEIKYEKAKKYLYQSKTITDMDGNEETIMGPTAIFATYLKNRQAYFTSVAAYRTAFLSYDMDNLDDQRKWQANEPMLRIALNNTYETWRSGGAAQVEQALGVEETSINSAALLAFKAAKEEFKEIKLSPLEMGGTDWHLSYAIPANWYNSAMDDNFTKLTLDSKNVSRESSKVSHGWDVGGSWSSGLWNVKASNNGKVQNDHFHMEADDFSLSAKIGIVRIMRPWFNSNLLSIKNWYVDSRSKFGFSTGKGDASNTGIMPIIPTAFIVAKDIKITANFSSKDKEHFELSTKADASVGWGPFKISGEYSHSTKKDSFKSTMDGGTITIPGMQIIAWVNQITPACPPMDKP